MHKETTPAYSISLPCDEPKTIAGVLSRLRRQNIADQIEVVITTAEPELFERLQQDESHLHSIVVVEIEALLPLGRARAEAVRQARADYVFLAETHSFPNNPDWAEKVLARHRQGWSVVVPGLVNANPGRLYSEAGFLNDYGDWMAEEPAREIDWWPLNNSSCKHSALMEQDEWLDNGLAFGDQLLLALADKDHKVFHESSAQLSHFNLTQALPWFDERWVAGVLIARHRSESWALGKRLFYTLASPLIGPILFMRYLKSSAKKRKPLGLSAWTTPVVAAGCLLQGFAEMVGYAHVGTGLRSESRMTRYEINKTRYIS